MVNIWTNLPSEVVEQKTINGFKNKLDIYMKTHKTISQATIAQLIIVLRERIMNNRPFSITDETDELFEIHSQDSGSFVYLSLKCMM